MAEVAVPFARTDRATALAGKVPEWAVQDRVLALGLFDKAPVETSALFHRHVIPNGIAFDAVQLAPPVEGTGVHTLLMGTDLGGLAQVVDGSNTAVSLAERAARAGVTFTTISEALQSKAGLARALLSAPGTKQEDKFFQLTRALYQDGLILDVPAGVQFNEPVRIYLRRRTGGLAGFTRIIVRLGEGARAEVSETHLSEVQAPGVVGVATEVILGPGAELRYAAIGNSGPGIGTFINRQAEVGDRATLHWALGNFGGSYTKSRVHTLLEGNGASVHHAEVVFGAQTQKFDVSSFVTHRGTLSRSDVVAKAALRQQSRANVKGMITIEPKALNTDSILGQFSLLLDPDARSIAIPGLEIETSQVVRAKHAASVQQLDDNQVYYLKSRGIPEIVARRLIVEGFLHPVIAAIASEKLRSEVEGIITTKWRV